MKRIDKIIADEEFRRISSMIKEKEFDRIFCKHSLGHSLSVARIAWIINLEEGLSLDKEMIYATALLHDMGRYSSYEEEGMSHHEAGAFVAEPILKRAGFTQEEIDIMCSAIKKHKNKSGVKGNLEDILYRADKLSRNCFMCDAKEECYWSETKKNKGIKY
ncbi:MAG: HD domain-containing protein [Eubacterium sp.]|nr:HD domain-containing protein [Eubacterium sp.]